MVPIEVPIHKYVSEPKNYNPDELLLVSSILLFRGYALLLP